MLRALLPLIALLWCAPAHARRVALDPENRIHLGAALTDDTSLGLFGGLDSRLTRIVYVDVGGFVSPVPLDEGVVPTSDDGRDYIFLRHGIYVGPGLRLPHRQPQSFQWDLTGRLGFAAVWSNDVHPDNSLSPGERYEIEANPSLMGGIEGLVRKDAVGIKLSARGYMYRPFSQFERADLVLVRPQYVAELVFQW